MKNSIIDQKTTKTLKTLLSKSTDKETFKVTVASIIKRCEKYRSKSKSDPIVRSIELSLYYERKFILGLGNLFGLGGKQFTKKRNGAFIELFGNVNDINLVLEIYAIIRPFLLDLMKVNLTNYRLERSKKYTKDMLEKHATTFRGQDESYRRDFCYDRIVLITSLVLDKRTNKFNQEILDLKNSNMLIYIDLFFGTKTKETIVQKAKTNVAKTNVAKSKTKVQPKSKTNVAKSKTKVQPKSKTNVAKSKTKVQAKKVGQTSK